MASGRPTLNTLIKALNSTQCESVDKAIALLSPTQSVDRVLAGLDQAKREQILDRILSFTPVDDEYTVRQLGLALVNSGVSSGKPNDGIMGLVALTARALEKGHPEWMEVLSYHAPGAVWMCVYTTATVGPWLKRPTTSEQTRWRMGQQAAKHARSKGAYQGSYQARKLIDLLETLMDVLPEGQFPLGGGDLPHVQRMVDMARDPAADLGQRLLRRLTRQALAQEARWVPERGGARTPRM